MHWLFREATSRTKVAVLVDNVVSADKTGARRSLKKWLPSKRPRLVKWRMIVLVAMKETSLKQRRATRGAWWHVFPLRSIRGGFLDGESTLLVSFNEF